MDVNPKKMGLCSLSHSDESLLRKILSRGPLTNSSIKEGVAVFSLLQPNEYEIWLKDRIELTLRVNKDNLLHDDYKPLIKDSKKQLNELLKKATLLGNTGQIPTYLWRVLQILNFATPKEAQLQSDEDKEIGNLTIPDAACLMVYPRIFGKHLCNKAGIDMPKITSLGQIDLHITSVECDCSATAKQRTNDLKEHRQAVCDALNINEEQYFLPPQLDMIDAGQLHKNAHGTLMEAFATTQVADDKLAMGVKRGVFRKSGDEDEILAFVTSLPHPEMALRGRFANASDELLKKYDKCITAVLRRLPELSDLPADVESDLFIKMKNGNMSEEEIAEREKFLEEVRQHALYMRWLPVVRPGCTSEDIQHAKKEYLKYNDFTEEEQAIIKSELREMGRNGGLVRALKFVGRDNPSQLVSSGFTMNDFTDDEWEQLHQMYKEIGKTGGLVRALKIVGRDNPAQLVASGFSMDNFTIEERNTMSHKYSEIAKLSPHGLSDEEIVKKIEEHNSVDVITKTILSNNLLDIGELLPTGVSCNARRFKDVSLLLQQKHRVYNITKFTNHSDNEILVAMLDVFSEDQVKQARKSRDGMVRLINSSDRIRVAFRTVSRIHSEGLFQGDLALKLAKAKKAVEAKPVVKKRKASQERINKRAREKYATSKAVKSSSDKHDSKPQVKKRKTESTSKAVKSSSDKHDSKPQVQKRKTESTSKAIKSSSDKRVSKPTIKKTVLSNLTNKKFWTCAKCSYEHNPMSAKECDWCFVKRK
eukprot:scaffold17189_cov67-Cyclotella_meneghiniana.AAC.7